MITFSVKTLEFAFLIKCEVINLFSIDNPSAGKGQSNNTGSGTGRSQPQQKHSHSSKSKKSSNPPPLTNGTSASGKRLLTPENDRRDTQLNSTETPSAAPGTEQMKEITPPDGILPLDSPSNDDRTGNGREEKWVSVQRRKKGEGKVPVFVCITVMFDLGFLGGS